jgi:hypothetical protein
LFVALGGVGYAAATINGKDIKNKTIAGAKLKNKTVTGGKIKDKTITGGKIKSKTLTSTQIDVAKLGKVPSATNADRASSAGSADSASTAGNVAGLTLRKFNFNAPANTSQQPILDVGGLVIQASCSGGGVVGGVVQSTVDNAIEMHQGFAVGGSGATVPVNDNGHSSFGPGDTHSFLETTTDFVTGIISYARPDGGQVTVNYQVRQNAVGFNACHLSGTAIAG